VKQWFKNVEGTEMKKHMKQAVWLVAMIGISFVATNMVQGDCPECGQSASVQQGNVIQLDPREQAWEFVPDQVLVKFRDGVVLRLTAEHTLARGNQPALEALFEKVQVEEIEPLFSTSRLARPSVLHTYSGQDVAVPDIRQIFRLKLKQGTSVLSAVQLLKQNAAVDFAEPNYVLSIVQDEPSPEEISRNALHGPDRLGKRANTVPDDPLFPDQWYVSTVRADAVWDTTTGDTSALVAILDTGVDWTHPDLSSHIWTNPAELGGQPGVDDDGNGFVDDVHGWDFVNHDADPMDDNSHGTHVAGLVAAVADNGIGIAGINWKARILPVKVFQSSGRGDVATITQGIVYAVENGATVINMSFGGYARSLTMEAVLANAYGSAVLVAAAGNDGLCIGPPTPPCRPFFPAALSYVLGVQATSPGGKLALFSNKDEDGPVFSRYDELFNYELRAPGEKILSTVPHGNYRYFNGTSMAAPIVSGAVALYQSLFPDHTQEELWGDFINTQTSTIDIYAAIHADEKPVLWFVSNSIVDTLDGDGDGRVDAGETLEIWFTVRNSWGTARNVQVALRLGEFEDPSVATVLKGQATIGDLSTYASGNNSQDPLRVRISPQVVNDRDVVLEALTWGDNTSDTVRQKVVLTVENGEELAGVLDSTLVLTADRLWLVTNSFRVGRSGKLVIRPGATLKIAGGKYIDVKGQVVARGTPDSMITFTSTMGVGAGFFRNTVPASPDTFVYCRFMNMGNPLGYPGGSWSTGVFYVDHCLFEGIEFAWQTNTSTLISGIKELRNSVIREIYGQTPLASQGLEVMEKNLLFDLRDVMWAFESPLDGVAVRHNNFVFNSSRDKTSPNPVYNAVFQISYSNPDFRSNNILSNEALLAATGSEDVIELPGQYWGRSDGGQGPQLWDFWDDPSLPEIRVNPVLSRPDSSAQGLVWKILIDGVNPNEEYLDPLGLGWHHVDVYFNRAMDTTVTPMVSFGVRQPFTQNAVRDSARWSADRKVWSAAFRIRVNSGDGLNRMRVARAKDWEGFEIPVEDQRFTFVIDAAGAASEDFSATPGVGKVVLEWKSPGVADLLGYNLYRFTSLTDSTYSDTVRINKELLSDTTYTDYDVTPGHNYYYCYKIVRTDFSQSGFSKVVGTTVLTASAGDANGDLSVDVLDVVAIVHYILAENPQPFVFDAADMNGDGTINILDLIGVINRILGKGTNFQRPQSTPQIVIRSNQLELARGENIAGLEIHLRTSTKMSAVTSALSGFEVSSADRHGRETVLVYSLKGRTLRAPVKILQFAPGTTVDTVLACDTQGRALPVELIDGTVAAVPQKFVLEANYPNPFNPSTTIRFGLPKAAHVTVEIYNLLGQRVRKIDLGKMVPGYHQIVWDGRTEKGNLCSSGVYLFRLKAGNYSAARKMMLLR